MDRKNNEKEIKNLQEVNENYRRQLTDTENAMN